MFKAISGTTISTFVVPDATLMLITRVCPPSTLLLNSAIGGGTGGPVSVTVKTVNQVKVNFNFGKK